MNTPILTFALVVALTSFAGNSKAQNLTSDLTNGLLNYYTFQGDANDSVGGNNISLTGNVSLNGGSLYINSNIDEYPPNRSTQPFSSSNINLTGNVSQSLSFWAKSSSASQLYAGVGFGLQPPWGGITELNAYYTSIWFHGYNANTWHMITFTYNTSQSRNSLLFYDGQPVWNGNINLSTAPGALYLYGNAGSSIDEIGVWNTALTSNQVSELYTQQAQSVPEPSALSLLAVGLGGLAMMRRRRS